MTPKQIRGLANVAGLGKNWSMPSVRVIHGSENEVAIQSYITGCAMVKALSK